MRISFSKKKFKHVKLLTKYNDELQQLLAANDELAPARQRRRKTPMISFLQSLQSHSQDLYSALLSRWTCSCPDLHRTSLLLEKHVVGIDGESSLRLLLEVDGTPKSIEVRVEKIDSLNTQNISCEGNMNTNLLELKKQVNERAIKQQQSTSPMSRMAERFLSKSTAAPGYVVLRFFPVRADSLVETFLQHRQQPEKPRGLQYPPHLRQQRHCRFRAL